MRNAHPQGIMLGGGKGQPARRIEWEKGLGEEARDLLRAPYPDRSRYLLFLPSFPLPLTVPKPRDLQRYVRNEDDAAATIFDTHCGRTFTVSKPGVSTRGAAIEGEAKKMRFPPYFTRPFTVSKAGVSVRLSAARQEGQDRPLRPRCPGLSLGGSLAAPAPVDDPTTNAHPASRRDYSVLPAVLGPKSA
jgi:hypothetical protein